MYCLTFDGQDEYYTYVYKYIKVKNRDKKEYTTAQGPFVQCPNV